MKQLRILRNFMSLTWQHHWKKLFLWRLNWKNWITKFRHWVKLETPKETSSTSILRSATSLKKSDCIRLIFLQTKGAQNKLKRTLKSMRLLKRARKMSKKSKKRIPKLLKIFKRHWVRFKSNLLIPNRGIFWLRLIFFRNSTRKYSMSTSQTWKLMTENWTRTQLTTRRLKVNMMTLTLIYLNSKKNTSYVSKRRKREMKLRL